MAASPGQVHNPAGPPLRHRLFPWGTPTQEPFDGWTAEGLGVALRTSSGDLALHEQRRRSRIGWVIVAAIVLVAAVLGWSRLPVRPAAQPPTGESQVAV